VVGTGGEPDVKSMPGRTRPDRSGCDACTPESRTATTVWAPLRFQVCGALMASRCHCVERRGSLTVV
jgi:hypothetical protein